MKRTTRHLLLWPVLLLTLATILLTAPREAAAWSTIYNCNNHWPDSSMPVPYRVNDSVTSLSGSISSFEDMRRIYQASFDEWSAPCCSSFSASDAGTTTATGENNRDSVNAVSVLTNNWPASLGDSRSTLGVTVAQVNGRCELIGGDTVFNAFSWTFTDGTGGGGVDFQSIATHEFGHFLGLGHTQIQEATMFPAYIGGTLARSLHSDDQEGVCSLYEQPCSCSNDGDCNGNQDCIDSVCQIAPCVNDNDCDLGLECSAGDCIVPPCFSDNDCVGGNICSGGSCVPDQDCPVCGLCDTNADCGVNGVCIPAGFISEISACTSWCQSSADCPGNSDCFLVPTDEGDVPLCFNADADVRGPCPSGYVCQSDDGPFNACDGVSCPDGQVCNSQTGQCQGGGDPGEECAVCDTCTGATEDECGNGGTCLSFVDGPTICSVACGADGSCPGDSSCFQLSDGQGGVENWCLNDDAAETGICSGGWTCEVATASPCEGVSCPEGFTCQADSGRCTDDGGGDGGGGDGRGDGDGGGGGGSGDDSGCATVGAGNRPAPPAWFLAVLGALLLRRRR